MVCLACKCSPRRPGSPGWTPILYLDQAIEFDEMVALYAVARACIVSSLRDGMNLVSYEYVACQDDQADMGPGVLILSEFAGAAQALGAGCVMVNPFNIEDLARAISEAIEMPVAQRTELHAYASRYINKHTSQAWAQIRDEYVSESNARSKTAIGHMLAVSENAGGNVVMTSPNSNNNYVDAMNVDANMTLENIIRTQARLLRRRN